MAEKPTDSPLSCLLENYSSLRTRDINRTELLPEKFYHSLDLLRIIFILTQLTKFEEGFQEMFKEMLDEMEINHFSWDDIVQVEESIKNYFYGILKEKDGTTSVRLTFSKRKSDRPDYPFLDIPIQKLPLLVTNCEEIIVWLVKEHQTQKEDPVRREEHPSQCVICLNENALIDIFGGEKPAYLTGMQEVEEGESTFSSDTVPYGVDVESDHEEISSKPTPVKEEVTGGEAPSTSDNPETEKFTKHKEERAEAELERKAEEFVIQYRTKIMHKMEKHQDNANYLLTYHSHRRNETKCKFFADQKTALDWASTNKKSNAFVQIWPKKGVESDDLTTTDLMDGKIDLTDPSTENVLYEKNGKSPEPTPVEKEVTGGEAPSTSDNPETDKFTKHKEKCKEAARKAEEFVKKNMTKIVDEISTREDNPNWILTYYSRRQKDTRYELFADKQTALNWAYKNKDRMEESYPCIQIWSKEEVEKGRLKTTDLMVVKIELIDPSTGNVLCAKTGMFDTGSDIASFPYDPEICKSLLNSMTELNGKWVPIVYAKLRINGEELKKIYKIEVESDEDWCAIGIPQMQDLSQLNRPKATEILQQIETSLVEP